MVKSSGITVNAYAKINLFLEVKEKLDDGYHLLESVMQSVTLHDTIKISRSDKGVTLDCGRSPLSLTDNIIIKAANAFFARSGIKGGADIKLIKRIPIESGLGGGSADAAATLEALNLIYGKPVNEAEMYTVAKSIGADVPFCLKKGLCLAGGIGEILTDIGKLPDCSILISVGGSTVSTKKAFEELDLIENREFSDSKSIITAVENKDLAAISGSLYNCFENINAHDSKIKDIMKECGASGASLSGSGPSVFGIFDNENAVNRAEKKLKELGYKAYICRPYYRSK